MTPSDKISPTVFVVADDQPTLDALEVSLDVLGFAVRAFTSLDQFYYFYRPQIPGCLLLDLPLVGQDAIQLIDQLQREGKRPPAIFITTPANVPLAAATVDRGVERLEKPFDREALVDRVRKALALDAEWRERGARLAALEDRIRRLDDRDRETLEMMQAGESTKSMAAKLHLTQRAVEMRRSAIIRKLKVGSVAELTNLAMPPSVLAEVRTATGERQYQ
jgi:FixJ family two-component response regulator